MTDDPAFIYALTDPRYADPLKAIRYVGLTVKTLDRRRAVHISEAMRSSASYHRLRWLRMLLSEGVEPGIILLEQTTRRDAKRRERAWIRCYRTLGCDLVNSTDGGEGILNPTPEMRAKLSHAARHRSPETRAKMRAHMLGRKLPPEVVAKMSAAKTGKPLPPLTLEARMKIAKAMTGNKHFLGHHHSKDTRARQSAAKMGNTGRLGKPHSDESKRKMSERARGEGSSSAKLTWDDVREIRRRYAAGGVTQTALCREYGVSPGTMCVLLQGKTWIEPNPV